MSGSLQPERFNAAADATWQRCLKMIADLPGMPFDEKKETLRFLFRHPAPGIRQQALRAGSRLFGDEEMTTFLREGADDVLRNAGLEMMKLRGLQAFSLAMQLLEDSDPDVVLQAVLILDHLRDPRALDGLRKTLENPGTNILQAAIVAIGHMGDGRMVPDLLPFLQADLWLQLAAVQALGDLRSPAAVPVLREYLADPFLSPVVLEALARIGGVASYRTLAENWAADHEKAEAEIKLGLLAHVLEGIPRIPPPIEGLRESLVPCLQNQNGKVRELAARCLLSIGAGSEDTAALLLLADQKEYALPACLSCRKDLVPALLKQKDIMLLWGVLLAARYPGSAPHSLLIQALKSLEWPGSPEPLLKALFALKPSLIAPAVLQLFLRSSRDVQEALIPLLRKSKKMFRVFLAQTETENNHSEAGQMLLVLLEPDPAAATEKLLTLPQETMIWMISQIAGRKEVMKRLPWQKWLDEEPDSYRTVALEVAGRSRIPEIFPPLRSLLDSRPSLDLVSAAGELGDRESVPILLSLIDRPDTVPTIQAMSLEAAGKIGGPEAHRVLKEKVRSSSPFLARFAIKGLALCSTSEDCEFFRTSLASTDWMIRLACVEALGKHPSQENLLALADLAADPVSVVAQRVQTILENSSEQ